MLQWDISPWLSPWVAAWKLGQEKPCVSPLWCFPPLAAPRSPSSRPFTLPLPASLYPGVLSFHRLIELSGRKALLDPSQSFPHTSPGQGRILLVPNSDNAASIISLRHPAPTLPSSLCFSLFSSHLRILLCSLYLRLFSSHPFSYSSISPASSPGPLPSYTPSMTCPALSGYSTLCAPAAA